MVIYPYRMNRLSFLLTAVLIFPAVVLLTWPLSWIFDGDSITVLVMFDAIAAVMLTIFASIQRLSNIGKSKWWVAGLYIPVIGLFVLAMLLALPENYKANGMDKTGRIIILAMVAIPILIAAGFILLEVYLQHFA